MYLYIGIYASIGKGSFARCSSVYTTFPAILCYMDIGCGGHILRTYGVPYTADVGMTYVRGITTGGTINPRWYHRLHRRLDSVGHLHRRYLHRRNRWIIVGVVTSPKSHMNHQLYHQLTPSWNLYWVNITPPTYGHLLHTHRMLNRLII